MRLDPKYFNIFVGTIGVFSIILIGYFTITYYSGQQAGFKERVGDGEELRKTSFEEIETGDSLKVDDLRGYPVLLDFWAPWSNRSMQAHRQITEIAENHPDLKIISALVKDDENSFREYHSEHGYEFRFVHGTGVYEDFLVPGVPSYVMFDREGAVLDVVVGYPREDVFDSLISYLESNE